MTYHKISAFDLDHTLIKANCAFKFGVYLCRKRYKPLTSLFILLIAYAMLSLKILSIKQINKLAFYLLFKGLKQNDVDKWVSDCLEITLGEKSVYHPAILELKAAKAAGHLTMILSSSPSFLVDPIAKKFNVDVAYSTTYGVDEAGHFNRIDKIVLGEDKAAFIRATCQEKGINTLNVAAYSDSFADIQFLKACGKSIGVNPDYLLRKACVKNNWPII